MKTSDIDIRSSLHDILKEKFHDDATTLVVDELGLCQGKSRVDIAVLNGSIHGYEIKSDKDSLERLPGQIDIYGKVLDTVTIVVGECHVNKILTMVPDWWGIEVAEKIPGEDISFSLIRHGIDNPNVDAYSVAQLLWRDEALDILKEYGLEKGYLSKPRKILWERLVDNLSPIELRFKIREKIKSRKNWRAD